MRAGLKSGQDITRIDSIFASQFSLTRIGSHAFREKKEEADYIPAPITASVRLEDKAEISAEGKLLGLKKLASRLMTHRLPNIDRLDTRI